MYNLLGKINEKIVYYILLFSLFLYIINEGVVNVGGEDFQSSIGASRALLDHSNIYFKYYDVGNGGEVAYSYTPFFATLLSLGTYFSNETIVLVWLVFNFFFLIRIFYILNAYFKQHAIKIPAIIVLTTVLGVLRFILHNIDMAQITIFLVYVQLESFYQLEVKKNKKWVLLLISLGISIKYLPLFFIFYLGYRKEFTLILGVLIITLFFTFLPFLFFEYNYLIQQYLDWWKTIHPMQAGFNTTLYDYATQSITTILSHYNTILDINLNETNMLISIQIARVLLFSFCIWIIYSNKDVTWLRNFLFLGLCLLLESLIMPHQQHYSFFTSIVLVFYVLYKLYFNSKQHKFYTYSTIFLLIISFTMMSLTSNFTVGKEWKDFFRNFQVIGIGSLFLLGSVAFASRIKTKGQ